MLLDISLSMVDLGSYLKSFERNIIIFKQYYGMQSKQGGIFGKHFLVLTPYSNEQNEKKTYTFPKNQ